LVRTVRSVSKKINNSRITNPDENVREKEDLWMPVKACVHSMARPLSAEMNFKAALSCTGEIRERAETVTSSHMATHRNSSLQPLPLQTTVSVQPLIFISVGTGMFNLAV